MIYSRKKCILIRVLVLIMLLTVMMTGCRSSGKDEAEKQSGEPVTNGGEPEKNTEKTINNTEEQGTKNEETEKNRAVLKTSSSETPGRVYSKDGTLLFEIDGKQKIDTENYLIRCILHALMTESGNEPEGFPCVYSSMDKQEQNELISTYAEKLATGGYSIYTSLDTGVMEMMKEALHAELDKNEDKTPDGSYAIEGAVFCCDRKTGKAVAFVSGRDGKDFADDKLKLYSYARRPGSAIKPLILYTPLLEKDYTPDSYVIDMQYNDSVTNSDGKYEGRVTLEYAVAKSKNTVACEMMSLLGARNGIAYLEKMNFDYLIETDETPYAAIGIFENGVTIPQMCSGFAAIASDGLYHLPTCVERIEDSFGNSVSFDEESRVYQKNAAKEMSGILQKVFEYGTAKDLKIEGLDTYGKTGTTSGGLDGWMCGYSGDYVTVVWAGITDSEYKSGESLAGNGIPGRIWKNFYESLKTNGYIQETESEKISDNPDPVKDETAENEKNDMMIRNLISGMSLKKKIYQLFIIVPDQLEDSDEKVWSGDIGNELFEKPVGGFIFFDRHLKSTDQVKKMLDSMKEASVRYEGTPMFFAVDEEGGDVVRLSGNKEFDLTNIGPVKDMPSENDVYKNAQYVGGYLSFYGFNLDFAPVADLSYPGSSLKNRTYSDDPEKVGRFAAAFLRGLNSQGIAGCYKHFPGIGAADSDLHDGNSYIKKNNEELAKDLFPFSTAAKVGADFVMVSHAILPQILDESTICSMSYDLVTGVLRQGFSYEGIIITDALNMASVTDNYTPDVAAVKAFTAGCDMLLMPDDLDKAFEGMMEAVNNGTITEERINESLYRIFKQKFKY